MTLAVAILVCALATLLLAGWRPTRRSLRGVRVAAAVLVPLAAFLIVVRRIGPATGARPNTIQIAGEYAPAGATITVGSGKAAAVRVRSISDTAALLSIAPAPDGGPRTVSVSPGMPLVLAGETPVNAARVRPGAMIALLGRDTVTVRTTLPRWPLLCLARAEAACGSRVLTVRVGQSRPRAITVRLKEAGVGVDALGSGVDPSVDLRLFLRRGVALVSSRTPDRVRIDDAPLPTALATDERLFTIADARDTVRLRLSSDPRREHQLVLFEAGLLPPPWPLPIDSGRVSYRVNGGPQAAPAGTLPLIDLATWPLGQDARPYAGALRWSGDSWVWHVDGTARALPRDTLTLLPGRAADARSDWGHVVRLASGTRQLAGWRTIAVIWLLAAIVLALDAATAPTTRSKFDVPVLGLAFTIVLVRSVLTERVTYAPPFAPDAAGKLIVLLCALPALTVLLRRWSTLWRPLLGEGGGKPRRGRWTWLGPAAGCAAALAVAPVAVIVATRGDVEFAVLAALVVLFGTAGLLGLQLLLLPAAARGHAASSPLAILDAPGEREFGFLQLIRAVVTLGLIGSFYVGVELTHHGFPWLVPALAHLAGVAAVWGHVALRERIVVRLPARRVASLAVLLGIGAGIGVTAAVGDAESSWSITRCVAAGVLGAVISATVALWVFAPLALPLRAGAYRRRDLLPPLWAGMLPAVGLMLSGVRAVNRLGITLGFALSVITLLVTARALALLWHRDTRERIRQLVHGAGRRVRLRETLAWTSAGLSLLVAYALVDRGLLQFVVLAIGGTAVVGLAAVGPVPRRIALVVLAMLAVLSTALMHVSPERLAAGRVSLTTPRIRYAATAAPDALQRQLLYADHDDAREIVKTLIQLWGARAHAALGGTRGLGLLGLAYGESAIARREALTDNAFSVLVLSEHGFLGGAALVGLYATLVLVLLAAAARATQRATQLPRALVLVGCALFLAVPALYMAAANEGFLPLTGQNLPLLGLRSGADVALFCWLAALAMAALPGHSEIEPRSSGPAEERRSSMHRVRGTVLWTAALVGTAAGFVIYGAWIATHREVAPFRLDEFRKALQEQVDANAIGAAGGRVTFASGNRLLPAIAARRGTLLRDLVLRANHDPTAPRGSHCLDRTDWLAATSHGIVVGDGCQLGGVGGGRVAWSGPLTTSASGAATLLSNGRGAIALTLPSFAGDRSFSCDDTGRVDASSVVVECVGLASFGVSIQLGVPRVATARSGAPIALDDRALDDTGRALRWGDVLDVAGGATFVVDSLPRAALGYARWRNGAVSRVITEGTPPLFARLDSLLALGLATAHIRPRAAVELTLDEALQRRVQDGIDSACARPATRQCAAILVDPRTGDILALAGAVDSSFRLGPYAALDANFRNHRAASTIKPLIATAVLAQYPALRTLAVEQPAERFQTAAGWRIPGDAMRAPFHGCPTAAQGMVDWRCFLPTSNNLFAVTLGFLGAALPGSDGLPALAGGAEGPAFAVGGRALHLKPRFEVSGGRRRYGRSPLARNLAGLFDAHLGDDIGMFDRSLWAPLAERVGLVVTPDWQRVSPDIPQLALDDPKFDDLHHLAGFMIGETDDDWSNAALVRAVSRIYTGRGVELRLLRRVDTVTLAPREKPVPDFEEARAAVLEGMRGVPRGFGTARALQASLPGGGFDFVAKTGTLDSRRFPQLSGFLFAGSGPVAAGRPCAVAGMLVVEMSEVGSAVHPTGKDLFASVVAPALAAQKGWRSARCTGEPEPRTPIQAGSPRATRPSTARRAKRIAPPARRGHG